MKLTLEIIDRETGEKPSQDELMVAAGCGPCDFPYVSAALTEEGLPIVLFPDSEYGYLDANRFEVSLKLSVD